MNTEGPPSSIIQFGPFEADLASGELRKNGNRLKLQEQPFQVLAALLERPSELVTREELRRRLWAEDTFVDFDNALNTAVNKIREVLEDSARRPRFVETIARRGYRWIGVSPSMAPGEPTQRPRTKRLASYAPASVVAVALVGAGAWLSRVFVPSETDPEQPLQSLPLTSYPGIEQQPSFSPDGNQVAYSWNGENQDNFDIYVQLIDTGTPLRLTNNPERDVRPAWSPDGKQIAFLRTPGDGSAEVLLVPPIGGAERRLGQVAIDSLESGFPEDLSWSPDGKNLILHDWKPGGTSGGIFLISVETGERRQLTSQDDRYGAFSPDGRRLAFFRNSTTHRPDLMLVRDTGAEPVLLSPLSEAGAWAHGPAWRPDGEYVVFAGGERLWEIPVIGGDPRLLSFAGSQAWYPALSHSGGRLAFTRRVRDYDIWRIDSQAPGAPPLKFISSTHSDSNPQFSPDGKRVVFTSRRSGDLAIWAADADGSNLLRLTRDPVGGSPRWSPDGQSIVYDGPGQSASDIFRVSSFGGPSRSLTSVESYEGVASFSQDGRWVYFASDRTGESQVWKVPVEGETKLPGSAVQVTQNGGFAAFESPDGKHVYYAKTRGRLDQNSPNAIWRVPAAGGREEPVVDPVFSSWGNWSVHEDGLYFVNRKDGGASPEGRWAIFLHRFSDSSISEVAPLGGPPYMRGPGFDVSPDGRWILCTQPGQWESDLMLVENFR